MNTSSALALGLPWAFFCASAPCLADNHRPFTYEWMASEAVVIAIGEFEESKRVTPEKEQKNWSKFVSRVRILHLFKGDPKVQSLIVVHYRWARENALPLANAGFAEMPRELAAVLDGIDVGESVDVSNYRGLFLMFLQKRDGKYYPVTGSAWENFAIQHLSGSFSPVVQEGPANEGNRHKTPPVAPKEVNR